MKKTFLKYDKPLITAMIICRTPEECIEKIKASLKDGADALGIQLGRLEPQYKKREYIEKIFAACENKPIYVMSYRYDGVEGSSTFDECMELLLTGLDCGATLCDIMSNLYEASAPYELATSEEAVKKQKDIIKTIHDRGGEVLMSCHTLQSTTVAENLMIAKEQIDRGADVIKIVNEALTEDEIPKYIEAIQKILQMTDKRLLFLVSGKGDIIRYIGPNFGVCMYLCVHKHGEFDPPQQPLIKNIKAIRDNSKFM